MRERFFRYSLRMNLPHLPLLILDTETTGFVPRVHRVIEFAAVQLADGKVVKEYEQLLSLEGDIPPHVQALTHIYPEDLVDKPTFASIIPDIQSMMTPETIIVGQNIPFDIGMIKGEGLDLSTIPLIDTSMLASIVFPEHASYSLGYLSTVLKLNHEPKHRALGDVHATLSLLEKCWERLNELSQAQRDTIQMHAAKAPDGYKRLILALTDTAGTKSPAWLKRSRPAAFALPKKSALIAPQSKIGEVTLLEESTSPHCIGSLIRSVSDAKGHTILAVKNLEAALRKVALPDTVSILYPASLILHKPSAETFLKQSTFTADELTLAIKLALYEPNVKADIPVHGNEYAVWEGKIAANTESPEYNAQFAKKDGLMLIDHQGLLQLIADGTEHFTKDTQIMIDDASMLEDSATHAYGWTCAAAALRAGAQGNAAVMKLCDLLELWMEKTRAGSDVRYLTDNDTQSKDADGLMTHIDAMLKTSLPHQIKSILEDAKEILTPGSTAGRISWIECFQDGNLTVKSVPENVARLLADTLYSVYPTSLIIPTASASSLQSIIPADTKRTVHTLEQMDASLACPLTLSFPQDRSVDDILKNADGKTVLLLSSKRTIEDLFVKYADKMEAAGVTLLCQGLSGGQGRMQAEFTAAGKPAILITTPWTYETFELPPNTVDHFVLYCLPFDHPSHAVFSRRSQLYRDPFNEYSLARLLQRLFRLTRTFCRHKTEKADIQVIDDRLRTKGYGKVVKAFFEKLAGPGSDAGGKKADEQMALL